MTIALKWHDDGLHRKFFGDVCGDDLLQSNLELQADRRFREISYVINDFTHVTSHSVSILHVGACSETDKVVSASKHELKIALVVPDGPMKVLAVGYRYLMRNQRYKSEIFTTVADAKAWCRETLPGKRELEFQGHCFSCSNGL